MKNFNNLEVHLKIRLLGGINQYRRGDFLKRELGQFADLREGGLGKKEGGWYPNVYYDISLNLVGHVFMVNFRKVSTHLEMLTSKL